MLAAWTLFSIACSAQQQNVDLNPHLSYTPSTDATKAKDNGQLVQTRERTININGVEYKQIEYKGDVFVVRGNQPDTTADCTTGPKATPEQFAASGEMKIAQRTKFFVESLRQYCDPVSRRVVTKPDIRDGNIGVKFEGAKPEDSEKKVFINPLNRTGGAGITF